LNGENIIVFFKNALYVNKIRFLKKEMLIKMLKKNNLFVNKNTTIVRPMSYMGKELLYKIQSLAFDSVFNLIDKLDFEIGLKRLERFFNSGQKVICCRDRYLTICRKK